MYSYKACWPDILDLIINDGFRYRDLCPLACLFFKRGCALCVLIYPLVIRMGMKRGVILMCTRS